MFTACWTWTYILHLLFLCCFIANFAQCSEVLLINSCWPKGAIFKDLTTICQELFLGKQQLSAVNFFLTCIIFCDPGLEDSYHRYHIQTRIQEIHNEGAKTPTLPPPHPHPRMKTSLFKTCSNKVTLAFQKHFENTVKKGDCGPLAPPLNPLWYYLSSYVFLLRRHSLTSRKVNISLEALLHFTDSWSCERNKARHSRSCTMDPAWRFWKQKQRK